MRGTRSTQVTLESRFITGIDAEPLLKGQWPAHPSHDGHDLWPRFLSNADVDILLRATQKGSKATIVTAPRITLFNGQRAYVMVTRQTAYVGDLKKRARAGGGSDDYEPVIKLATSGIVLDARAQVVTDDDGGAKYVTLMLNPSMSTLLDLVPQPWPGAPSGRQLTIQVPHTLVTHLKATITVPDGQTALFRLYPERKPATLPTAARPSTRPATDADMAAPTLLLVKPTVIEAKDEQKEFPLISTRLSDPATRRAPTTSSPAPTPSPAPAPRPLDSRR
jgi:hypothetical protein